MANGQDLPRWHHLRAGSKALMHKYGMSVTGRVQHEQGIAEDDYQEYVLQWVDGDN